MSISEVPSRNALAQACASPRQRNSPWRRAVPRDVRSRPATVSAGRSCRRRPCRCARHQSRTEGAAGPGDRVCHRKTTIIEAIKSQLPALVALARDICGTGFILRIERVEGLVETFIARLARVDRAADHRLLGHAARSLRWIRFDALPLSVAATIPKKRGPDQRAPVIARAMAESERCRVPFQR